jgi:NADH:ubiquinone oxidoreductase subunit C
MLGVTFVDHPDPRPLLLPVGLGAFPLRRDVGLGRRAHTPWPGAHEPGEASRRRPTRAMGSDSAEWSESL